MFRVNKAMILEGAVLAFALMRGRTWIVGLVYKLMLISIYFYGVWIISATVINSSIQKQTEIIAQQKAVRELEAEIIQDEVVRNHLWKTERITLARKYDLTLERLKQRLNELRQNCIQLPNSAVVWNIMATLVGFRILVLLCNLLFIQYLGRRLLFLARID